MSGTRHQATVARAMQQGVHAAQLIQFPEFFLDDPLDILRAKRAKLVAFAGASAEAST
jgi:predicted amidohydrolase